MGVGLSGSAQVLEFADVDSGMRSMDYRCGALGHVRIRVSFRSELKRERG